MMTSASSPHAPSGQWCVDVCAYLILFQTPGTVNRHQRSWRRGEVSCIEAFFWVNFLLCHGCQIKPCWLQHFPSDLPHQLFTRMVTSHQPLLCLSDLVFLLCSCSFLMGFKYRFPFLWCMGRLNAETVYTPFLSFSFMLFTALKKYVNKETVMWHCTFDVKTAGCYPKSLPNCSMANGAAKICGISWWLHHAPNYSTVLTELHLTRLTKAMNAEHTSAQGDTGTSV